MSRKTCVPKACNGGSNVSETKYCVLPMVINYNWTWKGRVLVGYKVRTCTLPKIL